MLNDELESQLSRVRQALANAVAVEIQLKQQIEKNNEAQHTWEKRAAMALAASQQELSAKAEEQIKICKQRANELQIQLLSQQDLVAGQKKELARLENRRFSTGGDGKKAVAAADATLSAIGRMENKISGHEALAEATSQEYEKKQALEKAFDPVEEELKALKAASKKEQDQTL